MYSLPELLEDMRRHVTVQIVPGGGTEWHMATRGLAFKSPFKTWFFESLYMISEEELERADVIVHEWAHLRVWVEEGSREKDFGGAESEIAACCIEAAMLLRMGESRQYVRRHLMYVSGFISQLEEGSDHRQQDALLQKSLDFGDAVIKKWEASKPSSINPNVQVGG